MGAHHALSPLSRAGTRPCSWARNTACARERCYVFQNVAASALCYSWGLGLAIRWADYRPWWVIGAWLGICPAFIGLATWWLRFFDRGPLELVWHWAYRAPQSRARDHVGVPSTSMVSSSQPRQR